MNFDVMQCINQFSTLLLIFILLNQCRWFFASGKIKDSKILDLKRHCSKLSELIHVIMFLSCLVAGLEEKIFYVIRHRRKFSTFGAMRTE